MANQLMTKMPTCAAGWVLAILFVICSSARGDETCNSPYTSRLIKGQEDYVHVWTLGVEGWGDGSDKLVTIDAHPKSKTYGTVLHTVSVGTRGGAHHMGFTDDRRYLWAGGLDSSLVYVFDVVFNDIATLVLDNTDAPPRVRPAAASVTARTSRRRCSRRRRGPARPHRSTETR
jgi:selenium-binding protein 1